MSCGTRTFVLAAMSLTAVMFAPAGAVAYENITQAPGVYFAAEQRVRHAALADLSRPARRAPTSTRTLVDDPTGRPSGSITVDTRARFLFLSLGGGRAMRYAIGVARPGFEWSGQMRVGRKAEWPDWRPPAAMLRRQPDLPRHMPGGLDNPLGARALYLYRGDRDSIYRIHGTSEPETIGQAVSSGCIRMLNADVIDLHQRTRIGAAVTVL